MFGMQRLSIQSKMILLLLAVALSALAVMAWIGYQTGKTAIQATIANQLRGMQVAKTSALKTRLESLRDQVISMSDSRIAIDGMRDFLNAYRQLQDVQLGQTEEGKLQSFYSDEFLPNLSKLLEGEPQLGQYIPKAPASKYLQYHYIAANPNSYNEKSSLDSAVGDSTVYSATHKEYHPSFVRAAKIFGFDDLMLVDAKSLDIIYSYAKTTEFATSLDNGPYSNTKLARKVRELQTAQDRDVFKIADFEAYRPSLGKPMAFAMSPIFDE